MTSRRLSRSARGATARHSSWEGEARRGMDGASLVTLLIQIQIHYSTRPFLAQHRVQGRPDRGRLVGQRLPPEARRRDDGRGARGADTVRSQGGGGCSGQAQGQHGARLCGDYAGKGFRWVTDHIWGFIWAIYGVYLSHIWRVI